jgi:uncharacterized protein YndB with AHSA1/START domain
MTTLTAQTTQVYQVFIKASPEEIWEAITTPSFTQKYFFGSHITVTPESFTGLDGEGNDLVLGAVSEYEPPHRLVHEWRSLYDPDAAQEAASRVSWEIEDKDGFSLVTVTHDQLEDSPKTAENVAGGWTFVLSGLKTLLETGTPLFDYSTREETT